MMSQSELEFHRKIARECFNETWNYFDRRARDARDEQTMLHLAHASRYHWSHVGNAQNFAIGDWQISRVYAAINQPHLALNFAKSALEICEKDNLSEVIISAYEGIARAYAVAKDRQSAKNYINKAREQLARSTADDKDKKVYSEQIRETEELMDQ
jgi:hypothetical protein